VFVSKRDGNLEIYRMLVGGQEQTNLTNSAAIDTDPAWQPAPAP
jgi:Tol biopolymer transport system component